MLGPGVVAGASDNDPTTVGTVALVGSTTVYALGWVVLLIFPLLAVVQAMAARVGTVTRRGMGELVLARYGRRASHAFLLSVLPVNILTLAADLKAGAAALALLTGLSLYWYVVPLAIAVMAVLLLGSYRQVRRILQYLALALLAYAVSAFLAKPRWSAVLHGTFVPSVHIGGEWAPAALALLGTTLTSYVYVWETIELSEEPVRRASRQTRMDALAGAFFGVLTFWFILIASAAKLGVSHSTIHTPEDAARALRPLAGAAASALFSVGLLASSLLAVPVLLASTAYLLGGERRWKVGLSKPTRTAARFYVVMGLAMALACAISFTGISTIHILFVASIAGAVGTPFSLAFLIALGRDGVTMGERQNPLALTLAGVVVVIVVSVAGVLALA